MKRPERICANFTNRSWLFQPSQSQRRSLTQSSNRRMWKSMKSLSGPPPRSSELPMNMTATIKRIVTRWTFPALMLIAGGFVCGSDIEAAHYHLIRRGIHPTDVWHGPPFPREARQPGPDPKRTSYGSFLSFNDPDGNMWLVQDVTTRAPGRV